MEGKLDPESSYAANKEKSCSRFEPTLPEALRGGIHETLAFDTDIRPYWRQLIIIGNGFDLACDLRSSFSEFFDPRLQKIKQIESDDHSANKKYGNALHDAGLTAWDLTLRNRVGSNWSDIESVLSRWVKSKNGLSPRYFAKLDDVLERESKSMPLRQNQLPKDLIEYQVHNYLVDVYPDLISDYCRDRLNAVMLEELHRLENEFDKYLSGEVDASEDYEQKSVQLILTLCSLEREKDKDYRVEASVLSFNYTMPAQPPFGRISSVDGYLDIPFINIHGHLGDKIVFGIDGSDAMSDSNVMPFTKTYRLMQMGGPSRYEVLPGSVDLIKFFGHSLSAADYSYFQAIFDHVGLYESETRLVFYYRPYSSKTELEVRTETMGRVIKLLTAYGRTLDNADHGNNLIHKLLLEGRLSVEVLPGKQL